MAWGCGFLLGLGAHPLAPIIPHLVAVEFRKMVNFMIKRTALVGVVVKD